MERLAQLQPELVALRERLSELTEASLQINESHELESVLQRAIDSARSLTDARYGLMLLYDAHGRTVDSISSGMTAEQADQLWKMPGAIALHDHVAAKEESLRLPDYDVHSRTNGLPTFRPPFPVSAVMPLLMAPMRYHGDRIGTICLLDREIGIGSEFSPDDQTTVVVFASEAALAISIARRRRVQQRVQAELQTLMNAARIGVLVFDAGTRKLKSINHEARKLFGDLILPGASVQSLMATITLRNTAHSELPTDVGALADALMSGMTVEAEDVIVEDFDGRQVAAVMNTAPVCIDGEVDAVVVTVQETRLSDALDRLRAEFLALVEHGLRVPLSSIKGSAAILQESQGLMEATEVAQFHRIISEQSGFMWNRIGDFIDIVCIETGTLSIDPQSVDVHTLLEDARVDFLEAHGSDIIHFEASKELPPVMADRHRIGQVLDILLAKAARDSHNNSPIRIDVAREGVALAVSVADGGKRVPTHLQERSPGPGDRSNDHDLSLGFAICKGIVEAHGGRIWAESGGPRLDSRFTFTLPVVRENLSRTNAHNKRYGSLTNPMGSSEPARVLVVDDDLRTLGLIRETLCRADYSPIVTSNPDEACMLLEEVNPHVVLVGMALPDTDTIELTQRMLSLDSVPVIFLSSFGQEDLVTTAFEGGAVDYIVKPFSPTELVARISAVLHQQGIRTEPYEVGDLTVDFADRAVTVAGRLIDLTPTEYRLMVELAGSAGLSLRHDQLLQRVWGIKRKGDSRPMRTAIKNLRRKLGDQARRPKYILTVPHVGYRIATSEMPPARTREP